jgi:hypothetical protein
MTLLVIPRDLVDSRKHFPKIMQEIRAKQSDPETFKWACYKLVILHCEEKLQQLSLTKFLEEWKERQEESHWP